MALRYPSMIPGGVDAGSIIDMFNSGYDRGRDEKARRAAPDLLAKLYGTGPTTQPAPQTLSGLGEMFSPQPQQGAIQRSPLPPPTDPATARVQQAFAAQGQGGGPLPSVGEMRQYIAQAAQARGIDPSVAIRVANSEGLAPNTWQSNVMKGGRREPSYGPFQMLVGGGETGFPEGLGNAFMQQTGLDPSDPANWQKSVDFALDTASKQGWGQWYGAKAAGIGNMQGINGGAGVAPSQQALEGLAVGQSMPMGQPVQVADATGQMMPQGQLPPLPDRETMLQLFANPITLPYAIEAARSRQAAMQDQRDPMKRLQYQKAVLELENLRNPRPKPTDDMREYEFARQQGFNGTFEDFMLRMKRASATNVNVGGAEKGFDKTLGEGYGKHFLDVQDQARAAQRALNALEVMDQALADPGFYSGAGGETVQQLKRIGASLGMDADGISSMETFNAMSKQAALDAMGGSLGTGFSNADRDFVVDQVPNLGNTQEGNRQLVEIQRKLNRRKLEIAQIARQYAARNEGRIDPGFDDYLARWAEQNPLFPPKPDNPNSGRGAGGATGRQRARNPQTGETIEWDGSQWRPVQ